MERRSFRVGLWIPPLMLRGWRHLWRCRQDFSGRWGFGSFTAAILIGLTTRSIRTSRTSGFALPRRAPEPKNANSSLTRLTNAFSKKWENLKAAIALDFAFYNFCGTHKTIRSTLVMESGLTKSRLDVADAFVSIRRSS